MEFLLNRFRNLTVLLLVILAQLVLLAYQVKSSEDVRLIRVWSVTAVTPIAKVLEVVRRNTIGLVEDYFILTNVREENHHLTEELGRLKMENQFLKTELQTADRAKALQVFQTKTPSRTLAARIIGTGTGANSRVVFVDQGSSVGVMRGMAVVTPDGIVGKVISSYPTASQVLLVTDLTFAAGVISEKNRVHGTIKGLGQSKCLIDFVQNEEKVDVGEMFYTSGDDRVFPKGMPVGKVTVVRPGKTFKEIYVVPTGLQGGLEEVLIVIEGVHQALPDPQTEVSSGYYILPPPPGAIKRATPGAKSSADQAPTGGATPAGTSSGLMTDADRLRERYKSIGEAQGHVFGTGVPGSRPPNFNIDPNAPKPQPVTPARPDAQGVKPAAPSPTPSQQGLRPAPTKPPAANPTQSTTPPSAKPPVPPVERTAPAKPSLEPKPPPLTETAPEP
jgi:rod shape-determining protein MreC